MTSLDIAREDTKDGGSPTIPPITAPSITNTVATDDPTASAAVANADTNMTASTDQAVATGTNGTTTNAVNATDSTATSTDAAHRTIKTIRKVAKRTPFPVSGAVTVAPVTVAEEEEMTTTATALQIFDDTHTQETETSSSINVTQEEGEEPVSEDDDVERRDATSKASPVAAADVTPAADVDVPTTTNAATANTTTTTETDTAGILAVEPHLNDVLFVDDNCQEDSKINKKWPGNRQYRAWIQARVFDFQHAASRSEQTRLAKQVSALVRRQNPAGRFLERLSLDADSSDNNATTTKDAGDKKSKSVWVELDETAVLMELSKSLWESPLENSKLSDKQQQMLLAKQEVADSAVSPMKNGDKKKDNAKVNANRNENIDNIENGGRTSRHEQQLLLQHAKSASQYGDYFHTLYITPVYSDSQTPSSNTAASMMQEKQQQRNQQHKKPQQRKLILNKSSSASFATKGRPYVHKSQDLPPNGDNDVEMDMDIHVDHEDHADDDNSEQSHDKTGESVDDSKLGKNSKAKRKSTSSNDTKKPTKQPKRSNSNSFDKPNKAAPKRKKVDAKRNQRSSNGTIVVSPLSVPSEPARRKPLKSATSTGLGFTTAYGGTVAIKTKPYRGGPKDAPKPARTPLPKMKKSEKRSSKQTTTDELGLPRGVTMRPSGKWQAQFYFAGQSRYIGVFQSAYDAAAAYEIVRERLDQARKRDSRGNSTLTKEARSQLFDDARRAAHEGVFENKEDNEYNSNLNYANKERPSNDEYAAHAAECAAILANSTKPADLLEDVLEKS